MGYDVKRFRQTDINEEFICTICQDVLQDPLLVDTCEHVFCSQCINNWLEKAELKQCPIDRTEITTDSLRPPQRSFRNLITSLLISCDFEANGCGERIKIDELVSHTAVCLFSPILRNQEIECLSKCGAMVKRCQLKSHDCVQFLKEIIAAKEAFIITLEIENKKLYQINELKNIISTKDQIIRKLELDNKHLSQQNNELILINQTLEINSGVYKSVISQQHIRQDSDNIETANLIELFETTTDETNAVVNAESNEFDHNIETSAENNQLIDALREKGALYNQRVVSAMLTIDRGLFCPSFASYALYHIRSINYGAHTGPSIYEAKILQYLEPHLVNNCKVLDIGSGSGYVTACIAAMIKPNGRVIGIDHIPQLVMSSIETIEKFYPELIESCVLKMATADGRFGFASEAPYDLIFVEALTRRVPQKLFDQLKPGGSIIVPIGGREKDVVLEQMTKQHNGDVVRLILCNDWRLMKENTPDLFDDKKSQLRSSWKVKLGF